MFNAIIDAIVLSMKTFSLELINLIFQNIPFLIDLYTFFNSLTLESIILTSLGISTSLPLIIKISKIFANKYLLFKNID